MSIIKQVQKEKYEKRNKQSDINGKLNALNVYIYLFKNVLKPDFGVKIIDNDGSVITQIKCHKILLPIYSEYFKIFFERWADDQCKTAELNEEICLAPVFRNLLTYMYTGILKIDSIEDFNNTLTASRYLLMGREVDKRCYSFIVNTIEKAKINNTNRVYHLPFDANDLILYYDEVIRHISGSDKLMSNTIVDLLRFSGIVKCLIDDDGFQNISLGHLKELVKYGIVCDEWIPVLWWEYCLFKFTVKVIDKRKEIFNDLETVEIILNSFNYDNIKDYLWWMKKKSLDLKSITSDNFLKKYGEVIAKKMKVSFQQKKIPQNMISHLPTFVPDNLYQEWIGYGDEDFQYYWRPRRIEVCFHDDSENIIGITINYINGKTKTIGDCKSNGSKQEILLDAENYQDNIPLRQPVITHASVIKNERNEINGISYYSNYDLSMLSTVKAHCVITKHISDVSPYIAFPTDLKYLCGFVETYNENKIVNLEPVYMKYTKKEIN